MTVALRFRCLVVIGPQIETLSPTEKRLTAAPPAGRIVVSGAQLSIQCSDLPEMKEERRRHQRDGAGDSRIGKLTNGGDLFGRTSLGRLWISGLKIWDP